MTIFLRVLISISEINPRRPFSLTLNGVFTRKITPFTQVAENTSMPNFGHDTLSTGPKLVFASRSGILRAGIGYNFGADFFEAKEFNYNNSITHEFVLDSSWQFLPKTSLTYDGYFDLQNYTKADDQSPVLLNDNRRLRSRIGINGELTPRVSLTTNVGYAAGFFDAAEDYSGVIAQVQLRWQASQSFGLKLGWERSYDSAYEGNYSRTDRFYTNGDLMVSRVFLLNAEVWVALLKYGIPLTGGGNDLGDTGDPRKDVRVSASLGAEYRFVEWLGVNAKVAYTMDVTKFKTNVRTLDLTIPSQFKKFEAWLGVRAFY